MAPLANNFQGLQHIGLPVTDLARSKEFYTRLGFREVMATEFALGSGKGYVSMMERQGAVLELYQLPEEALAEVRSRRDGHIDHVAFNVADVSAAFAELQAAGFEMVDAEPIFLNFWQKGCRFFRIVGPDGEKLEFNQVL